MGIVLNTNATHTDTHTHTNRARTHTHRSESFWLFALHTCVHTFACCILKVSQLETTKF